MCILLKFALTYYASEVQVDAHVIYEALDVRSCQG